MSSSSFSQSLEPTSHTPFLRCLEEFDEILFKWYRFWLHIVIGKVMLSLGLLSPPIPAFGDICNAKKFDYISL
jgi:hypothetical protein